MCLFVCSDRGLNVAVSEIFAMINEMAPPALRLQ